MNRREKFRQNLSSLYLPKYDQLCAILPAHWQPYQGYRTITDQNNLYQQGRSKPGHIVTDAKGMQSAHNYGCASDWTLWDVDLRPIWLDPEDSAWQEYWDAIEQCGLRSGREFADVDHNELKIQASWVIIGSVCEYSGMDAARALISRMRE